GGFACQDAEALGLAGNDAYSPGSTYFANPAFPAESYTRTVIRCSPGLRCSTRMWNCSSGESVSPSAASTGSQGAASTEYSQRRSADAASCASTSSSALAPLRCAWRIVTIGGVLSMITGELTRSLSRAASGGFDGRSEAITRKKYRPSASTSLSSSSVFSVMLLRIS